jgi:DNA-binding NarL/FixJ family response regulator
MEIVGECSDGDEVEAAVGALAPDIVLMDVRMKRMNGAEATRRLQDAPTPPPVLVLTTFDDPEVVSAALGAGAAGFILKDARGEDLLDAVRHVAGGGGWLDPGIADEVIQTYRASGLPRAAAREAIAELTERERDVLALIGRGATNSEVAADLCISEGTVKSHIGHIFTKLALRDRAAAIVFAFDHGLVRPGGATTD